MAAAFKLNEAWSAAVGICSGYYGTDPQQCLLVNTLPPQQTWKVKQSTMKIFILMNSKKNVLKNSLMEFDLAPAQLQDGSWSTSQSS